MIEYDYELKREDEGETRVFKPLLPKELDNLTYIEGPNSSGKSSLLNIFALGFFGLKNKNMNDSLKRKIEALSNSERHKLKFFIKATNKEGTLQLISKKDDFDGEILVEELRNGDRKRLTAESFEKKYHLIYDIPENPITRLNELLNEIRNAQKKYGDRVRDLKEKVNRTILEIHDAKNPERVRQLVEQKEKISTEKSILQKSAEEERIRLDLLEVYTYHRFFQQYSDNYNSASNDLEKLESSLKFAVKQTKKEDAAFDERYESARSAIHEMNVLYLKVSELLNLILTKDKNYLLELWKKRDIERALTDFEFDKELKKQIDEFKNLLKEKIASENKDQSVSVAKMYKDLITVLEHYKDLNVVLPGTNKPLLEFIEGLKKYELRHESRLMLTNNIHAAFDLLGQLNSMMIEVSISVLPGLIELDKIRKMDKVARAQEKLFQRKEVLEKRIQESKKKFDYYDAKYTVKGKPSIKEINEKLESLFDEYQLYNEEQLSEKINGLTKELANTNSQLQDFEFRRKNIELEVEKINKKKEHPLQNKSDELNVLHTKLNLIDGKLNKKYSIYLEKIGEKIEPDPNNEEQKKYNLAVFQFLGVKLGEFRHIDKTYTVTAIDFINQKIETKEKVTIHLDDMGTGQSQSAYLKSILKISEDRMIIAMFDEIAMMDESSLEPVLEQFKKLYQEQRLLIGIIVQKAPITKIKSLL